MLTTRFPSAIYLTANQTYVLTFRLRAQRAAADIVLLPTLPSRVSRASRVWRATHRALVLRALFRTPS